MKGLNVESGIFKRLPDNSPRALPAAAPVLPP